MSRSTRAVAILFLSKLPRLALGLVLVYSGLLKIRHPQQFLSNVYDYQLVGPEFGKLIAIGLPFLELTFGACLIFGIYVVAALLGSAFLGTIFAFVTWLSLHRGLTISCGCFGGASFDSGGITASTVVRASSVCMASLVALFGTVFFAGGDASGSTVDGTPARDQPASRVHGAINAAPGI